MPAVTELIPEIFVALSPTIFPFAFISPVNVDTPATNRLTKPDVPSVLRPVLTVTSTFVALTEAAVTFAPLKLIVLIDPAVPTLTPSSSMVHYCFLIK